MNTYYVQTQKGAFPVTFSPNGLVEIEWPTAKSRLLPELTSQEGENGKRVVAFFQAFFSSDFQAADTIKNTVTIDLRGTEFQLAVWAAIKNISAGSVLSYQELAMTIQNPKALRAIGGACGKNPIPLLIPCHRVVASGGKLGGYSGKMDKKELLAKEGIHLE